MAMAMTTDVVRFVCSCRNPSPSLADPSATLTSFHTKIAPGGLPAVRATDRNRFVKQQAASVRCFRSPLLSSLPPSLSFVRFPDLHLLPVPCALHQQYEARSVDRFPVGASLVAMDAEVNNSSANPIRSQSQSLWSAVFATAANHYSPPFLLNGISQFVLRCLNC